MSRGRSYGERANRCPARDIGTAAQCQSDAGHAGAHVNANYNLRGVDTQPEPEPEPVMLPVTFRCRTCEHLNDMDPARPDSAPRPAHFESLTEAWQHLWDTRRDGAHDMVAEVETRTA